MRQTETTKYLPTFSNFLNVKDSVLRNSNILWVFPKEIKDRKL